MNKKFHRIWPLSFNQAALTALKTIFIRELVRFTRIWIQTLLPPAITMMLYFLIFGNLIGARIGDMQNVPYVAYIAPGLIMMAVITNSYGNVSSSFFSARFQRNIEELLVSPTPNIVILLGYILGGVCRGLAVGVVVTLVALFFVDLSIHNIFVILLTALLSAFLFSQAGFLNGIFARTFDDISIVPTFILTPLTYMGGVFYSISMLSEFWQTASKFNPILYMVNAFRYGFLGITDVNLAIAFGIIVLFNVILFATCLYLLEKGVGIRQ